MPGRIAVFVSYRRSDRYQVRSLVGLFPTSRFDIFRDIEAIRAGEIFSDQIVDHIAASDIFLAVIASGWVTDLPRLQDPEDWVRKEIEFALKHEVPIVPVLVDSAEMPDSQQLPPVLREFTSRQWRNLRDNDFERDVMALISEIEELVLQPKGGSNTRGSADFFVFRQQVYTEPVALAAALSHAWSDAIRMIETTRSGDDPRSTLLTEWLTRVGLAGVASSLTTGTAERALASLIVSLDPESTAPSFEGHPVSTAELAALVHDVVAAGWAEGGILHRLLRSGALSVYARLPGQDQLALIDERWQASVGSAERLVEGLPEAVTAKINETFRTAIIGMLLFGCLRGQAQLSIDERVVHGVQSESRRSQAWYRDLLRTAEGDDLLARQVLLYTLGPIADHLARQQQETERLHRQIQQTAEAERQRYFENQRLAGLEARRLEQRRRVQKFLWPNVLAMLALSALVGLSVASSVLIGGPVSAVLGIWSVARRGWTLWATIGMLLGAGFTIAGILDQASGSRH